MTYLVGILCGDKNLKRAFLYALIIAVAIFLFLSNFAQVFAQGGGADSGGAANRPPINPGSNVIYYPNGTGLGTPGSQTGGGGSSGGTGSGDDFRQTPEEAAAQQARENAAVADNLVSPADRVLGLLYSYVLTGIGWVVGIAGSFFDYAIEKFIIGFGQLYITGTGETIDSLWSTVRDIFNLTFIFGLVYIGFKMILDSSDSSARKMLVSLIGAALLVNFSLFITKFVIDFSNIAATQVYNAFESSGELSITNGFMTIMGINSLIQYTYAGGGSFAYVIGVFIIFCILAYVFLAGAVMITIRFVVLNIYMVFSPFMFLGWVFPALASYSRDYWSGFLRQAFFAPAFIFMLYLSYIVASTFPVQRNLDRIFNPNVATVTEYADTIPYFAMVMIFLCASMVVAKKMGAHGSTMAVSVGKNISGRAGRALGYTVGGATAGVAARVGRNTIGAGANAAVNSAWMKRNAPKLGRFGKGIYNATAGVADSSFDVRKVAGVGKAIGIGEGKKGGYTTRLKETKESDEKFFKALGTVDKESDPNVKKHRSEVTRLENLLAGAREDEKEELQYKLVSAKQKLREIEKAFGPAQKYANQLTYIESIEKWQKAQHAVLTTVGAVGAGIGASVLTGGILTGAMAATSVAGAATTGVAAAVGVNRHNKEDIKAMRKKYGDNGSKAAEDEEETKKLKKMMSVLKDLEPKEDKKADKKEDKKDDH